MSITKLSGSENVSKSNSYVIVIANHRLPRGVSLIKRIVIFRGTQSRCNHGLETRSKSPPCSSMPSPTLTLALAHTITPKSLLFNSVSLWLFTISHIFAFPLAPTPISRPFSYTCYYPCSYSYSCTRVALALTVCLALALAHVLILTVAPIRTPLLTPSPIYFS